MEGVSKDTRDEAFATLDIFQPERKRKINLQRKVDTGAQSNVLPARLLRIIAPEKFDVEGNPKAEALERNEAFFFQHMMAPKSSSLALQTYLAATKRRRLIAFSTLQTPPGHLFLV